VDAGAPVVDGVVEDPVGVVLVVGPVVVVGVLVVGGGVVEVVVPVVGVVVGVVPVLVGGVWLVAGGTPFGVVVVGNTVPIVWACVRPGTVVGFWAETTWPPLAAGALEDFAALVAFAAWSLCLRLAATCAGSLAASSAVGAASAPVVTTAAPPVAMIVVDGAIAAAR
jgi:hypothetical protein